MSRLTIKEQQGDYIFIDGENMCPNEVCTKLGKLEDLEEELGCPLEVIFEALKNGIYKKDEDIIFEATLRIHNNETYLCQPYDDKLLHKVLIKDYQKTWWLKGEKKLYLYEN